MNREDKKVNQIVKRLINNARGRSRDPQKTRGKDDFTLTHDWVYEQMEKQGWKCPYTGVKYDFGLGKSWHGRAGAPARPSINRLNPLQGYTPENCEVVANWYNAMMGPYTHREVSEFIPGMFKSMAGSGKIGLWNRILSWFV